MKNNLILITAIVLLAGCTSGDKKEVREVRVMYNAPKTMKPTLDKKEIKFVLHKRESQPASGDPWYTAVIRPIDPAKDDYKAYCRYIVDEVVKEAGRDDIVINIIDNPKAYDIYEIKYIQNRQMMSKSEMQYVEMHTVGSFLGRSKIAGELQYEIDYYQDCKHTTLGKYTWHEKYQP